MKPTTFLLTEFKPKFLVERDSTIAVFAISIRHGCQLRIALVNQFHHFIINKLIALFIQMDAVICPTALLVAKHLKQVQTRTVALFCHELHYISILTSRFVRQTTIHNGLVNRRRRHENDGKVVEALTLRRCWRRNSFSAISNQSKEGIRVMSCSIIAPFV